jgi:calcineurin-like phosphoesterase family protein
MSRGRWRISGGARHARVRERESERERERERERLKEREARIHGISGYGICRTHSSPVPVSVVLTALKPGSASFLYSIIES